MCLSVHPSICQLYVCPSIVCFLSKHQWIFTKLGMCVGIVEIGLRLLMGKFRQLFTELRAGDMPIVLFGMIT